MEKTFKIGDKVQCISDNWIDWEQAKEGRWIGEIFDKTQGGWLVKWDNGNMSACLQDSDLVLAEEEPVHAEPERKPKAGEVWRHEGREVYLAVQILVSPKPYRTEIRLCSIKDGNRFRDSEDFSNFAFAYASLQEYFAAQWEPAQSKPEPRTPKCGEIWRDTMDYLHLISDETDNDGDLKTTLLSTGFSLTGILCARYADDLTFVYDSLAAAVAAGETFAP